MSRSICIFGCPFRCKAFSEHSHPNLETDTMNCTFTQRQQQEEFIVCSSVHVPMKNIRGMYPPSGVNWSPVGSSSSCKSMSSEWTDTQFSFENLSCAQGRIPRGSPEPLEFEISLQITDYFVMSFAFVTNSERTKVKRTNLVAPHSLSSRSFC